MQAAPHPTSAASTFPAFPRFWFLHESCWHRAALGGTAALEMVLEDSALGILEEWGAGRGLGCFGEMGMKPRTGTPLLPPASKVAPVGSGYTMCQMSPWSLSQNLMKTLKCCNSWPRTLGSRCCQKGVFIQTCVHTLGKGMQEVRGISKGGRCEVKGKHHAAEQWISV